MQVTLVQLSSGRDIDANLASARTLAERAAGRDTDWLLFPENTPFLGKDREKVDVAEPLDGRMASAFADIAEETGAWVTLGSFPEAIPDEDRTYNTQVLYDPSGERRAVYRKLHLFDVDVEGNRSFRESNSVRGGDELVDAAIEGPDGSAHPAGLTICYDLRFPELYRSLAARGAEIITVPSAFTRQTGRDHWHPLLQARAIENQCYILAPNQWGHHFGDRSSYGHSAVYDPWGRRLACAPETPGLVHAELDFDYQRHVRGQLPCLEHPRLPIDRDDDEIEPSP